MRWVEFGACEVWPGTSGVEMLIRAGISERLPGAGDGDRQS